MKFLNEITKETLIICGNDDKNTILRRKKLLNIKIMNIDDFISKYVFDYDENTILYIMKKYNVKYEIALIYLKNIYYVENKKYNINKLDFLVNLKVELERENLLKYNIQFKEYLKGIDVIVYGIKLSKFEKRMLGDIKYKYIESEYMKYDHNVYCFDTMEEEIEYIAIEICKLIDSGVSVKNIKLTNVDSSYYNTLGRIFSLFGLKIDIPYKSCLVSFSYVKKFVELYRSNELEYALNNIDKKDELYGEIINVINKYIKYGDKDLIIYKLENSYIKNPKYNNAIKIIDYLDYSYCDDDYVFMIGFNDGLIPKSYKDIDFITDNIKKNVDIECTKEKNELLRKNILMAIYNIKNLIITYKLRDMKKAYYPSSLISYFNVFNGQIDKCVSYSEIYNKIKLTKSIDEYIKYGYKNNLFSMLYNNFEVDYNSYDNRYQLINRVMDKLILSYSKMQIYNKCAFRYYLSYILKLDIYEENFSTVIGNMIHYVLEKCLANDDLDPDKYVCEFLGDREFTNREKFFLDKYKLCIKDLLEQINLEKDYGSFDNALYEKKIDIELEENVKFTGVIDKILYKEENDYTYVALIDYKTGKDDISLKYLNYGLNIQLPIYLYLSDYLNLRKILYSGFYLQRFNITDKDYRLIGYSNSDRNILSIIDNHYEDSKIIKGMKTLKDGSFSNYAKVLNNQEIDKIKQGAKIKILEVIENIKNNRFDINPKVISDKNIGCEFCKFKDICFVKKGDKVEMVLDGFGGEIDGMD